MAGSMDKEVFRAVRLVYRVYAYMHDQKKYFTGA